MKILITVLTVAALSFFSAPTANAQCNSSEIIDLCVPNLPNSFMFLKSYEVNGKGGQLEKVEYSYPFAKGTDYMINLCPQVEGESLVVTLYDYKRNEIATNVVGDQIASAIVFSCKTTGIYYITYSFDKSKSDCGGSVIGLKKSN
ncbi:MAG: hypothetical protein ABFS32_00745 [Bacteroidota bacterium]